MNVLESLISAFSSVTSNKMRSILTMLGIIIGISSVIMITAIGIGFQQSVQDEFESLGLEGLHVTVRQQRELRHSDYLTLDDQDVIMQHPNVSLTVPVNQRWAHAPLPNAEDAPWVIVVMGNEHILSVQYAEILHGRFLVRQDVVNRANVVVIEETLARQVFGRTNGVGETIQIRFGDSGTHNFTVVGITKSDMFNAMFDAPPVTYIPITTGMDIFSDMDTVDSIYFMVHDNSKMDNTALEVNRLLELNRQTEGNYNVARIMEGMDVIFTVLSGITAFVGLVGAISLLVGGIGVMNIMLVTVTERTREIGIRKSLGATDGNIKFQFLVEAMILTAIGGFIGILIGYGGAFALGSAINVVPAMSLPIIIGTVVISSGIGIVFGVYPASKAAKLDPIEALRYE